MTDKEKLETLLMELKIPMVEKPKSLEAGSRKYYFNEEGEIVKIIDRKTHCMANEHGAVYAKKTTVKDKRLTGV